MNIRLFTAFFLIVMLSIPVMAFSDDSSFLMPSLPPIPADNSLTAEKIKLGKSLFFDPRLSKSNWISCATCHNPTMGFADGLPRALGHKMSVGPRNTPTVLNSAFLRLQFWDGRAKSLEEQALGPIEAPVEMAAKLSDVIDKLKSIEGYTVLFNNAFPADKPAITKKNLAKAISAYERTLITTNSAFDRYLRGDRDAISKEAADGFRSFKKLGCSGCHNGPVFSDGELHRAKIPGSTDSGLYNVTKKEEDKYKFRTPILRNISLTGPYMHDGSVNTLNGAVKLMGKTMLDEDIPSKTLKNIVAFLRTLRGEHPGRTVPTLPWK